MKVSDFVWSYLEGISVKHVFMLAGGGAMHLVDSLGRSNIKYICNLHEQAATIAAAAYAQYNNDIGVALVTTGPGGTNALTGVAAAWLDSVPLLVISGQVKRADMKVPGLRQRGFQELNIVDIVKPITKYAVTVTDPDTMIYHLHKATRAAKDDRPGPVWLDIPLDVQSAEIKPKQYSEYSEIQSWPKYNVSKVIKLLNSAVRPVILAGAGIKMARSSVALLEFAETFDIPVLTTWRMADLLPEDHPLFIGRPGIVGQRGANIVQQNADLIISIGARLDYGQTGYDIYKFAPSATKVVVDIDPIELSKHSSMGMMAVNTDAKLFIDYLLSHKSKITYRDNGWLKQCQ